MATSKRSNISDLRGTVRIAFDAAEATAEVVEKMHCTVQMRPWPLGDSNAGRTKGITGFVYGCVRGGIRLAGQTVDASFSPLIALLPEGDSSPVLEAYRSVVNGLCGDHLLRTSNPLAIDMSLRYRGERVDPCEVTNVFEQHGETRSAGRLLVLVHGLCMNDLQWNRDGHDHGAALSDELGYLPLYLRYNSGLSVASNGRSFAELLETLVSNLETPLEEIVIVGHSMGGLVARGACHYGREAGHAWPEQLRKLVFLGTPHHGAPLEMGGHGLDGVLDFSPYSMPLSRVSKARSAGIRDLRNGEITGEAQHVPLPFGVKCYAAAAVRAAKRGLLSERLVGDGLVSLDSALGRHQDAARALEFPTYRQWIGYQMGHQNLLNHPDLYKQISAWLREPA